MTLDILVMLISIAIDELLIFYTYLAITHTPYIRSYYNISIIATTITIHLPISTLISLLTSSLL